MKKNYLFILLIVSFANLTGQSSLNLPAIFSDNMVLQQKSSVTIWGHGNPNDEMKISASWGNEVKTIVEKDSSWQTVITTQSAGGPYNLIIDDGKELIEFNNVMLGEVWLCSGQSNMEMPLTGWPPSDIILNSEEEIGNSSNDQIRLFTVERDISVTEKEDCKGEWLKCDPSSVSSFSATAYFFGRKLYNELKIPIGLIHSSWGGTPAEAWTSNKYLSGIPEFENDLVKIQESIPASLELSKWLNQFPRITMENIESVNIWENLKFNDEKCSKLNYNHNTWPVMKLPTKWEETELGAFDGAVWFRKTVELNNKWLNEELRLELGPIDDFDITYVNGKKVGGIEEDGNWQTPRIYNISKELNNISNLTIAVRVNDTRGGGGIYGLAEELKLVNSTDGSEMTIAGEWHYLPVAEFRGMEYFVFGELDQPFKSRPILPIDISSNTPTLLYNAMIAPLVPFKNKGRNMV